MSETTAPPPPALNAVLRPCPFCGAPAMLEPDPWMGESVRIACSSESCCIMPRTEYLLVRFADELCAAWNGRPAPRRESATEVDG